jgi:hypothetical protein
MKKQIIKLKHYLKNIRNITDILLLLVVLSFFISCEKDSVSDEFSNGITPKSNYNPVIVSLANGIAKENEMLKFRDIDHINETLDKLYVEYLKHDSIFVSQFLIDNLNFDALNLLRIEDSLQYNEYLLYEQFELSLSFSSLRAKIERERCNYENSNPERPDNESNNMFYLDNHFVMEEEVRSILNEHCELIIDNDI